MAGNETYLYKILKCAFNLSVGVTKLPHAVLPQHHLSLRSKDWQMEQRFTVHPERSALALHMDKDMPWNCSWNFMHASFVSL